MSLLPATDLPAATLTGHGPDRSPAPPDARQLPGSSDAASPLPVGRLFAEPGTPVDGMTGTADADGGGAAELGDLQQSAGAATALASPPSQTPPRAAMRQGSGRSISSRGGTWPRMSTASLMEFPEGELDPVAQGSPRRHKPGRSVSTVSELDSPRESAQPRMLARRFPAIKAATDSFDSFEREDTCKMVGIRFEVFRIYSIDTAGSNFKIDFELFLEWEDPELVDLDPSTGCYDRRSGWEPGWTPAVLFHNQYDKLHNWGSKFRIVDRATGRVEGKLGYRGAFYDVMDLSNFPLDRQVLHVVVAAEDPIGVMEFCEHPSGKPNSMLFENLAEWRLDNPMQATLLEPVVYNDILGDGPGGFQRYIIQIRVERRHEYFFWNVHVLLSCLVMLSVTSWAVPPDTSGERLAVTLTLVLSVIAFKFAIAGMLPLVPYLTRLDQYMLISYLAIVAVACENATAALLHLEGHDELSRELDKWFFTCFIVLWVLLNVFIGLGTRWGWFSQEWAEIEAADETRGFNTTAESFGTLTPNRRLSSSRRNSYGRPLSGASGSYKQRRGSDMSAGGLFGAALFAKTFRSKVPSRGSGSETNDSAGGESADSPVVERSGGHRESIRSRSDSRTSYARAIRKKAGSVVSIIGARR